tara:strand:- start:879 stop:1562 length:684 start_codon:yes stop_codon:yes gene_type:complete
MLPSLVHLRESQSTGVGYKRVRPTIRERLVTIEHERSRQQTIEMYPAGSNEPVQVYGTLRITVSEEKGTPQDAPYLESVWSSCLQAAATEAYDVMADLAEAANEAESQMQKALKVDPNSNHLTPLERFYYRRQHFVSIPANAPNLQPQQFTQRDFGPRLAFVRGVIAEATANLANGVTLEEVSPPYMGAAQDVDAFDEEEEAHHKRARNTDPVVYPDFRVDEETHTI